MGGKHKQQQVHRSPLGRRAGWWGKLAVAIQEIVFQSSLQLLTRETPHLRAIRLGRKWTECGLTMMESDTAAARRQTDGLVDRMRCGIGERREEREEKRGRTKGRTEGDTSGAGEVKRGRLRRGQTWVTYHQGCDPTKESHSWENSVTVFPTPPSGPSFLPKPQALKAARRTSVRPITGKMEGRAAPIRSVLSW